MKTMLALVAVISALSVAPIDAKRSTTKIGCVEARNQQYELSTTGKKGQHRRYVLVGAERFADAVGHRVKVTGHAGKKTLNVESMQTMGSCR